MALIKVVSFIKANTMKLLLLAVSVLMIIAVASPSSVSAQSSSRSGSNECAKKGVEILPSWYKYVGQKSVDGQCELDFTFPNDIGLVLLALVEILLRIATIVSVIFVIYGGFLYMTTQGEPDKAKAAQQSILNAVIGLVIALLATVIVTFIGGQLIK